MNPYDPRYMKEEIQGLQGQMKQYISAEANAKATSFVKDLLLRTYDRTVSYTRIVLAVGYAGFFTFWNSTKDDLPKTRMLLAGLFMAISLFVYISSEVYVMISNTFYYRNIKKMLEQGSSGNTISKLQELERQHEETSFWTWFGLLAITLTPAMLGATLLIGGFVVELCNEITPEIRVFIDQARYSITLR